MNGIIRMTGRSSFMCSLLALAALMACGRPAPMPYEIGEGTLQVGSLHYARAGCARCHGAKWDGSSEEAKRLKESRGLVVPDFKALKDPETTPVDYFKAITGGTPKLKDHVYHQYTDAARWAMAHFLYSMAPRLGGSKQVQREEAIVRELAEASRAYQEAARQGNRRWQAGFFQPVAERAPAPALSALMNGTTTEAEPSRGAPTAGRINRLHREVGRGKDLFAATCAGCHGSFGEGAPAGVTAGSIPCKTGIARCSVSFASRDIRGSAGGFAAAHQGASGGVLPTFIAMSADDVRAIFDFLGAEQ